MSSNPTPGNDTLAPDGYRPRVIDAGITDRLSSVGAVLIEGPKGCGKTWTGLRHARSAVRFDGDPTARRLASVSPDAVLEGRAPRLLDEWQLAPDIWNHVRHACDRAREPGRFLLAGSAEPADDIVRHSGPGRIARARMRPMSLLESGMSDGAVSLAALLDGDPAPSTAAGAGFRDVLEALCVGGWPWLTAQSPETAQRSLRDYLDEIRRVGVNVGSERGRDPVLVERLIISLARNTSTTAPNSRLAADIDGGGHLNHQTVRAYLDALARVFVIEDLPAWPTHLRSRARLTKSPKRHFTDPSLAAAAIRAGPDALMADLETCGLLFESLVVRDLRVYAEATEGDVFHCRLSNGLEADAVVRRRYTGEWMAVEVKLSHSPETVDAAARSLLRLADAVDAERAGRPSALVVITAGGYSYTRADSVTVTPIAALGP